MRESEHRLRLALEAGQMGWWKCDEASDSIHWSESLERLNGLELRSFGGTFADFLTIHADDRDTVTGTTASALADGQSEIVYRIEIAFLTKPARRQGPSGPRFRRRRIPRDPSRGHGGRTGDGRSDS